MALPVDPERAAAEFPEMFTGLTVEQRLALYEPQGKFDRLGDREVCKSRIEYKARLLFVYYVYDCKCRLCGFDLALGELTADHIEPRSMGGGSRDDSVGNLWPSHFRCNGRKGSRRVHTGQSCPFCKYDVVIGLLFHECFHCGSRW